MVHLAIDIGASSGRHIIGYRKDGELCTEEVYRFANGPVSGPEGMTWDIAEIVKQVKAGISKAAELYGRIDTLSVDTWGVDYVLMNGDREILPVYSYRDDRGIKASEAVHRIVPFHDLYELTGIQYQPFNSIYQLYADQAAGRLTEATDWLMIPEYILYKLCGVKVREYTNATTSGLVSAFTKEFEPRIIKALSLPEKLFPKLTKPGTVMGEYKGIKVVACATHDTASAVEGIPMGPEDLYISSGTWSLLGVKSPVPHTDTGSERANYANEGGVGYYRYQKNIMGMWVVNRLREELCPDRPMDRIISEAEESSFTEIADINDASLLAPESMAEAYGKLLRKKPQKPADYFCSAFHSLAHSYAAAIRELESNTRTEHKKLYIVGGGAKNRFLNSLTADAAGKEVIALPIEATALGNLKIQTEAVNEQI